MHRQAHEVINTLCLYGDSELEIVESMKNPSSTLSQAAAFIDSCSNLVAELDTHQAGGAMFVCCVALLLVGVVVVALTVGLRMATLASCKPTPKARNKTRRAPAAAGNSQPRRR